MTGDAGAAAPTPELNGPLLLNHHRLLIERSAISAEVAQERGYRSAKSRAELRGLGFTDPQCRVPALVLPVWGVNGEIASYQIRPDTPRVIKGKAVKYETPKNSHIVIDVPPRARPWIRDPGRPLFITEGVRKADAGVSIDACTIALLGVWNWRGSNEFGGKTTLPEWDQIALKDRLVCIVFDSDLLTKSAVQQAMWRLRSFLDSKGAKVRVVRLPNGDGGAKVGMDDYIATGKTIDDLLALASDAIPEPEDKSPTTVEPPRYEARSEGLIRIRKTPEGDDVATLLTNFCATIEAEVVHDDGVEIQRAFRICASWQGGSATVTVPAREFDAMNWATEHLGVSAIVYAGMGARDNARTAILVLSGRPPREVIYT
ncbi:MAG: DUF3854 domain-containing protein, partial [Planctomycetes bacterium]|nr:DUF3854 domain-containing protein [Planctomycetota bacterium]